MTWNQKKYIDCSERPNGLSLKDNSFLTKFTSHLEVSGFYHQQLPIVYLDLYFCLFQNKLGRISLFTNTFKNVIF